jgi:hypothetical protein
VLRTIDSKLKVKAAVVSTPEKDEVVIGSRSGTNSLRIIHPKIPMNAETKSEINLTKWRRRLNSKASTFYRLKKPGENRPHQVYGKPKWERTFGRAEWSEKSAGFSTGRLLPPYGEPRKDLSIILPSPKVGDFVWTWYSDCLVTDSILSLLRESGFTGFDARPIIVEKIKRLSRRRINEEAIPPLWELPIRGKGGDAAPESGIYVYEYEEAGEIRKAYSSFRNGIIVDEDNWDGSDFFTVNGYPKYILITERVKEFIIDRRLTNCSIIPSDKLEWESGIRGEDSVQKRREMAARPLESLLADLENPDVAMSTIQALGRKGDPGAVDRLIEEFNDPSPLIWHSASDAVASIAKHKQTPDRVREEIFSKLCALLGHDDPLVRNSAATALGFIGSEQAVREVMRLLEDPDDRVRGKVVFVMGFLRYRPALDAVRRLTRDRSKEVRETARMMADRIECDYP